MEDELLSFTNTLAVLRELAEDVKAVYAGELVKSGHPTRMGHDRLTDTITTKVTVDGHSFSAILRMNKYWEYLEEGTGPARGRDKYWPNKDAIAKWVEIKPVIPRPDGNKKIPTAKQLTFLISRKIHDEGTKGTHDLQKTKETVIPYYIPRIEEALQQDIGDYIRAVFTWE